MNLVKYQPRFRDNRIGNFIDDFFNKSISEVIGSDFTINAPALNVLQKNDFTLLELAAPGLEKSDFKILIEDDRLNVSVAKKQEEVVSKGKYTRREFDYKSFNRSFLLPDTIDQENIQATYELGVLRLELHNLSEEDIAAKNKKIEIS
jgi:HSP20 family protein